MTHRVRFYSLIWSMTAVHWQSCVPLMYREVDWASRFTSVSDQYLTWLTYLLFCTDSTPVQLVQYLRHVTTKKLGQEDNTHGLLSTGEVWMSWCCAGFDYYSPTMIPTYLAVTRFPLRGYISLLKSKKWTNYEASIVSPRRDGVIEVRWNTGLRFLTGTY